MSTKPDYRIGRLSLLGLIGFIVGGIILFYPDLRSPGTRGPVFHEVVYVPKEIIRHRVDTVISKLKSADSTKQFEKGMLIARIRNIKVDGPLKDSLTIRVADIDKKINAVSADIKRLNDIRASYEYTSATDTSSFKELNNSLHFNFTPEMLRQWDADFCKNNSDTTRVVGYTFKDKLLSFSMEDSARLVIRNAISDIGFMTKYPNAGLWVLMFMVFCSFMFIATSTSFYLHKQIKELFTASGMKGLGFWNYVTIIGITIAGIFAMWGIGILSFNDDDVVRSIFFMRNITTSMLWIQGVGFIAGACCLAGFVLSAGVLAYFVTKAKVSYASINEKKAVIEEKKKALAIGGGDKLTLDKEIKTHENELTTLQVALNNDKEKFEKLRGHFQTYFILSAIILSLLVLCTGFLYSTINNLDFVKMISSDWGYSPARPDFIYLYGAFYTVILLLVYIPAKMRFSEISFPDIPKTEEAGAVEEINDRKWWEYIKNPFAKLSDLLVAASPLLASLVQSLFEMLFD